MSKEDSMSSLLAKLFSIIVLYAASVTLSCLTFIYGWGLHPASWTWIIGGAIGGLLIYVFIAALGK